MDKKTIEKLNKLIEEGVNITRQSQEGDAIYNCGGDPVGFLHNTHRRYIIWKDNIKRTINGKNIKETRYFFEADGIPNNFGGIEFGNIQSIKSQNLLKNIRLETGKKLEILEKIISEEKTTTANKKTLEQNKKLITRRSGTGEFFYKAKLIEFKNKKAIYYLIFECLYEEGDIYGFCSYEQIDNYLTENKIKETANLKKRIRNGLTSLFRFSNLPKKSPDNKKLIDKIRGKGLVLYNPFI